MTISGGSETSHNALEGSSSLDMTNMRSIGKINFGSAIDKEASKAREQTEMFLSHNFENTWSFLMQEKDTQGTEWNHEREVFLRANAPEAVEIFNITRGPDWLNTLTEQDVNELRQIALHGFKKGYLGLAIVDGLNINEHGITRMPLDEEQKMVLVHKAIAFDHERVAIDEGLSTLIVRMKFSENVEGPTVQIASARKADIAQRLDKVMEKNRSRRREVSEIFEKPKDLSNDEKESLMELELNEVVPSILESAAMLNPESNQRLLGRLGVLKNRTDETYTIAANDRQTEGQLAMYMVLVQRVLNRRNQARDREIGKAVRKTRVNNLINEDGADLLVFHAFEMDSAKDCGRYFQELVRREILRERINEMVSVREHTPPSLQDLSDREAMRGAVKVFEEAFFKADGVFRVMAKAVDTIFTRKFKPGSFLHRILGGVSGVLVDVADKFDEMASEVPHVLPRTSRPAPNFPDLFAEF